MTKPTTSQIVTKSNDLIEASYSLTLNEQRLVLACIAQLDGRKPLPKDNLFTVAADEFVGTFGVDPKSVYAVMAEAAKRLFERHIKTHDGRNKHAFRWVYHVIYHEGEGRVTLGFSPTVAPYLTLLHKRFTSYQLQKIAQLKTVHAIRLYEMLMQFRDTGSMTIKVSVLKERLEVENNYPRFADFRRCVIDVSVKELAEKSGLEIEWEPLKKGRSVDRLKFTFKQL